MTELIVVIASILGISAAMWAARRLLDAPVCPICLGVGGTWLWMVVARELGYAVDVTLLAMLLGGSVAGVAYQLEKRLPQGRSALLWKTLFIPVGFVAAAALVARHWPVLAGAGVALAALAAFFLVAPAAPRETGGHVEDLTRKMRDCC